ncbi:MAG: hypothetical protein KDK96_08485 [Chlamydiia bacterium]|nr:hypothetical protein [Chlamydiia bacterium]
MSSVSHTTNSLTPLSQSTSVSTQVPEQRTNIEPSFLHVVMPEAHSLSNRSVEQLPSQSSSISLSVPAFGDLHISQEKEKAFGSAKPVFIEDDLELPSVIPKTMIKTALPVILSSAEPSIGILEQIESAESKTQTPFPVIALPDKVDEKRKADPIQTVKPWKLQKKTIPEMAFGKAKWEKYFGDVGVEPPLPKNIDRILNSPCVFWPEKKVQQTHLLILIPATVDGKSFHLNALEQFIQNPRGEGHTTKYSYYYDVARIEIGNQSVPSSYWALITKDVVPNSQNKSYTEQQALIKESYTIPTILEMVTGILIHYVQTKERLYKHNYTRTKTFLNNGFLALTGSFSLTGLTISDHYCNSHLITDSLYNVGLSGVRKL